MPVSAVKALGLLFALLLPFVLIAGLFATTSSSPSSSVTPAAVEPTRTEAAMPLEAPAPEDDRPNIVVVLTDDMRTDDLDYMPVTRRLISERGVNFTEATSPHPLCCPARAELVTGQYAQNNGVRHNSGKFGGWKAMDSSSTVATWFAQAGYHNGFVGKYVNQYPHKAPIEPGWHEWHPLTGRVANYLDFGFQDGSKYRDDYITHRIEERTNLLVEKFADADRPFLIYSNHLAPHDHRGPDGLRPPPAASHHAGRHAGTTAPMRKNPAFRTPVRGGLPALITKSKVSSQGKVRNAPASQYERKWRARIESLLSVDDAVESLVATLERNGELDNTYIFFTSDNGYSLGEHRLYKKNLPTREVLQVPLAVVGPDVGEGVDSSLPVTLIDLVATMVDVAEVRPGLRLDGTSFAPSLANGRQSGFRDTTLIQTGTNRTKGEYPGWGLRGVRTARYTYARDVNSGERLLFDREADRFERVNAASRPRYRSVVRELNRRTDRLIDCAGAKCNRRFGPDPRPAR